MAAKSILFVCPYPFDKAPSQRLKFEQYFDYFRSCGYIVDQASFQSHAIWDAVYKNGNIFSKIIYTIQGYIARLFLLFKLPFYDLVYIHLWVTPFGPPFFEWLYRKLSEKIIFDIDDLVFLGNASDANSWISRLKGKQKPIYLMKKADHVITCTPFLDQFVRKHNPNTTDISSTIQTDKYQIHNKYTNDHKIILGWSGSHSTAKYLYLLTDVLKRLNQTHPFKLLVMGTDNFYIEGLEIEAIKWSEEIEISTIQRFDIGLYPLPDELWVHGKSGLKALQYMACGIPTIASKVGEAIERVITHNENGFLVSNEYEWIEKLKLLIDNPQMRREFGSKARERVVKHYSINANQDKYINILNSLIEK